MQASSVAALLLSTAVLGPVAVTAAKAPPHILLLVVDDLGWANVGFHRQEQTREVQTPEMDALVQAGLDLNRHCESRLTRRPLHPLMRLRLHLRPQLG